MTDSFTHTDVFPLISRLITDQTNKDSDFVRHADIVDFLLGTAEGVELIESA